MDKFKFRNKQLAYQVIGNGTPVVLIHGFGGDSRMWHALIKRWKTPKVQIIILDMPGFGQTELIPNYSINTIAETINALFDHLHLEKIILIGHSMGGYASLAFAHRFPEKLLGIGLFHSHPFADDESKKENRLKSIDFVRKNGVSPYVQQLIPKLFAPAFADQHPEIIRSFLTQANTYEVEAIANALEAMRQRPDRTAILKEASFPVLFIIGEEDQTFTLSQSMEQTHLPNIASIHLLKSVGHMGMVEATDQTKEILEAFLSLCLDYQDKT